MEILTAFGIVALTLLTFFIIQTLIKLQATLKKLDSILIEAEVKLKKLNALANTVENIGEITEKETEKIKNNFSYKKEKSTLDSEDLAAWLVSSIKLGINIFKKR